MSITRKSFIKTLSGVFASLCFWKKSDAKVVVTTPEFDEFGKDGLNHIMWAIDKELGRENGTDPWPLDEDYFPGAPKVEYFDKEFLVQLHQRWFIDDDDKDYKLFQMKWGPDDFSPVFSSSDHGECWDQALKWASTIPNSKVVDKMTLVITSKVIPTATIIY